MMNRRSVFFAAAAAIAGLVVGTAFAEPSKNFKVFLCFGQSNMSGGAGCSPDAESQKTSPRVMALGFSTSSCGQVSRTLNKWSAACEPMHCGDGVASMGPSYVFGQVVADSFPSDTIGLIPAGVWGASIEMFMQGGKCKASQYFKPTNSDNCREWLITKCQEAVKRGVLSGMIFEQGESNNGDGDAWLTKVKTIYEDLKKSVPFDKDVPFVAGELLASGDGKGLNPTINKIPQTLPLGYVASSQGLTGGGSYASLHFSTASYRTLGQRFGIEMVKGLRKLATSAQPTPRQRLISPAALTTQRDSKVYALDGRFVSTGAAIKGVVRTSLRPGNLYVVSGNSTGASIKLMVAPTAR